MGEGELELANRAFDREKQREELEWVLKRHRQKEEYLKERIDCLEGRVRVEEKRNVGLGVLKRESEKRREETGRGWSVEEKAGEYRRVFEIKERQLDRENERLKGELEELNDRIELIDMEEWRNEASILYESSGRRYSDINSMIEEISMESSRVVGDIDD